MMALSFFDDKTSPPTEAELKRVLGKSHKPWCRLRATIEKQFTPIVVEWGFASKSTGWGMRLKAEKRAVLYMTPCLDYFLASFALGEKAVKAAHAAGLPESILDAIDKAPKYAEGRGVRIEVRTLSEVAAIVTLAEIKMAN
jgi:hypothetical protein